MTAARPATKKKYRRIAKDIESGFSIDKVMRRNTSSRRTVFAAMKKHGVSRVRGDGSALRVLAQIVMAGPATRAGGQRLKYTMAEIAAQLGSVSRQRVHQVFTEAKTLGLLHPDLTTKCD